MTYQLTKTLLHLILRVPKDQASFLYFTLESNEGMCFYSTLDESLGQDYRDIDLKTPIEWKEQFSSLMDHLKKSFPIEILVEEEILDKK